MHIQKALLFIAYLLIGFAAAAQDTLFLKSGDVLEVKVRHIKGDSVEYHVQSEFGKLYFSIHKKYLNTIKYENGLAEQITHTSLSSFYSALYFIESNGDTTKEDTGYNPVGSFATDASIQLKRFKDDIFYMDMYSSYPHFYINDPNKKFLNSTEITYLGTNFAFAKLVSEREIARAVPLKFKYLKQLCIDINGSDELKNYQNTFVKGKKTWIDTKESALSCSKPHTLSWVAKNEYAINAGKIPSLIKALSCQQNTGLGLVFIVERLSKPAHAISGYWVVFDFSDRKPLLIDYIEYDKIHYQFVEFSIWCSYWRNGFMNAGIYIPQSFQKYLQLEKKGQFQLAD